MDDFDQWALAQVDPDAQKRGRRETFLFFHPLFFRRDPHSWSINRYYTTERRRIDIERSASLNCAIRATCFRLAGRRRRKKSFCFFRRSRTTVWTWLVDVDDRPSTIQGEAPASRLYSQYIDIQPRLTSITKKTTRGVWKKKKKIVVLASAKKRPQGLW